jgi:hypothetical protein
MKKTKEDNHKNNRRQLLSFKQNINSVYAVRYIILRWEYISSRPSNGVLLKTWLGLETGFIFLAYSHRVFQ